MTLSEWKISPGQRVTIAGRHGQTQTGRVVMVFPTHCVLNLGGAHGTPAVASDQNIVKVSGKVKPGDKARWIAARG